MRMTKRVKVQLSIFATVAVTAGSVMIFGYIKAPAMFGVGRYTVTMQLTQAAGLYESANVTYRGTEVGRVTAVTLTDTGVDATLSLRSDVKILRPHRRSAQHLRDRRTVRGAASP